MNASPAFLGSVRMRGWRPVRRLAQVTPEEAEAMTPAEPKTYTAEQIASGIAAVDAMSADERGRLWLNYVDCKLAQQMDEVQAAIKRGAEEAGASAAAAEPNGAAETPWGWILGSLLAGGGIAYLLTKAS